MLVNLNQIFNEYPDKCIAAFNVFGYEDSVAVIRAAERLKVPVVLMANKVAVSHMPIPVLASFMTKMAQMSHVPVCVHLDHSENVEDIICAIESGFTSVMFDGSQLPFEKNARLTRSVVEIAHPSNVSVEAEIGSVGYTDPSIFAENVYTEPKEALQFYEETHADAIAVSVGTIHRQTIQNAQIQYDRLDNIRNTVDVPLVIHGSSSVKDNDLTLLAHHGVKKINLGTCLRLVFGNTLRKVINEDPNIFDRIEMFKKCIPAVEEEAANKIKLLNA